MLLERVLDRLRPRTLYGTVAGEGLRAARAIYPHALSGDEEADDRAWAAPAPRAVAHDGRPGVIVGFDRDALLDAAVASGATIELVPAVGEFVARGQTLLRVHGTVDAGDETLRNAIDVDDERTIHQDPAFAVRIIVDTSIRALSPAVNDPTTAVQALDVLEMFVRELAARDLEASAMRDPDGAVRVAWHSPSWTDLLALAFDEIRVYGASSLQIARRLRAVLEDLRATTPPLRHPALGAQLELLDAAVRAVYRRGVAGARDRAARRPPRPRAQPLSARRQPRRRSSSTTPAPIPTATKPSRPRTARAARLSANVVARSRAIPFSPARWTIRSPSIVAIPCRCHASTTKSAMSAVPGSAGSTA